MNLIYNAQKVLDNYDPKKFHDNLVAELDQRGLKKGIFCKKIGKPSNWIKRRLKWKPEFPVLLKMQKLGYDILGLAGLEQNKITFSKNANEEILIHGQIISLNALYHKIEIILSSSHDNEIFIGIVNNLYKTIQDRKQNYNLKENSL